ncbi:MAG: helix-turn-helix domain-containing protein [Peptostreptococcaceae bacterium]|nr:helix-turn-helix domain-containing protein [Peptostreptococcaceae bacterium]
MISMNLKRLRKIYQYTQENIAEKINVSRQSIAKWESGESTPDVESLIKLSKLYNVSLDNLVNHSEDKTGITIPPKGKYFFGAVSVGERGQIVIPKEAREVFNINSGDKLLILGDDERGIAVIHQRDVINFIDMIGIIK